MSTEDNNQPNENADGFTPKVEPKLGDGNFGGVTPVSGGLNGTPTSPHVSNENPNTGSGPSQTSPQPPPPPPNPPQPKTKPKVDVKPTGSIELLSGDQKARCHQGSDGDRQKSDECSLKLEPMAPKPDGLPMVHERFWDDCYRVLKDTRLVMIGTTSRDTGLAIAYGLIEKYRWDPTSHCQTINSVDERYFDFNILHLFDLDIGGGSTHTDRALEDVYFYVTEAYGKSPIINSIRENASLIEKNLHPDSYFVCLVDHEDCNYFSSFESCLKFLHKDELESLITLLNLTDKTPSNPSPLAQINVLLEWIRCDEAVRLEKVYTSAQRFECFKSAVERELKVRYLYCDVKPMALNVPSGAQRDDRPTIVDRYQNNEFTKAILFVSLFYKEISPYNFHRVAMHLSPRDILSTHPETHRSETVSLTERQRENKLSSTIDELIREQYLRLKAFSGESYIQLYAPEMAEELEKWVFESQHFATQSQFSILIGAGLLFDSSQQVRSGIIHLAVTIIQKSPGTQEWVHWFRELLNTIQTSDETAQFPKQARRERQHIGNCLSEFLRKILQIPALKDLGRAFYREMLGQKQFSLAFDVALDLNNIAIIKEDRWIEQCIHQASDVALITIQQSFATYTLEHAQTYLEMTAQWFSSLESDDASITPLHRFAFNALLEFIDGSVAAIIKIINQQKRDGAEAEPVTVSKLMKSNLLSWERSTPEDTSKYTNEQFHVLLSWLFHPHAPRAFRDAVQDETDDTDDGESYEESYYFYLLNYVFPNILLALWYVMQDDTNKARATQVRTALIDQFAQLLTVKNKRTRKLKQIVMDNWDNLSAYLLDIASMPEIDMEIARGMRLARRIIKSASKEINDRIRNTDLGR